MSQNSSFWLSSLELFAKTLIHHRRKKLPSEDEGVVGGAGF